MDLRPQAHEIIRTWLFYTVLRSHAVGRAAVAARRDLRLDPRPGPQEDVQVARATWSRRWTCCASTAPTRSGTGRPAPGWAWTPTFDLAQIKVGRRLAIKILNATRFVLGLRPAPAGAGRAGDRAARPGHARPARRGDRARCTAAFEDYDHAGALELAEQFFWQFCDDYLELVKPRAYGEHDPAAAGSAQAALRARCRCCSGCSRRSCRS